MLRSPPLVCGRPPEVKHVSVPGNHVGGTLSSRGREGPAGTRVLADLDAVTGWLGADPVEGMADLELRHPMASRPARGVRDVDAAGATSRLRLRPVPRASGGEATSE